MQNSTCLLFEQPLGAAWVYPCSLDDIRSQLARVPYEDLEGLYAVGLVASTRKDNSANGRYFWSGQPVIHLFSYPADYRVKLLPNTKVAHIDRGFIIERLYGMEIEQVGSRYVCHWKPSDLRRFITEHVLWHEIGHHVHYWQRSRQGLSPLAQSGKNENFAEHYALRRKTSA